ncbi:MAG: helix-turn-helix transcriptional regulator [Chloroflexi bacterium]|nr:helix-turn-helix transcriptional regulator [Chloroflexota bacterium]
MGSSNSVDLFIGAFCLVAFISFGMVLVVSQLPLLRQPKPQPRPRPAPRTSPSNASAFSVHHYYQEYEERWTKNLTERERQVARLAAEGLRNAEIGRKLVVADRTVGNHLQSVFHKLGIRSRGELKHILRIIEPDSSDDDAT